MGLIFATAILIISFLTKIVLENRDKLRLQPMMLRALFIILVLIAGACQIRNEGRAPQPDFDLIPYAKLSAYQFFKGVLADLIPAEGVLPYELRTPLFTDYAHKARFVWMPPGSKSTVDQQGNIIFPEHTILIKNFFYPDDFGNPGAAKDMVETRLLIKRNGAWEAFTYEWNEKGTDAELMQVGNIRPVSWVDETGTKLQIDYVIPNKNQCKSCHNSNGSVEPIGPKARNLNFEIAYPDGSRANQLQKWQLAGYLEQGDFALLFPAMPHWSDPSTGTIEKRAAAYLDVNCGHCHRPEGPANTTGTFLHWEENLLTRRGLFKSPVAAGKGSGGRSYGIVPGKPDESILVYRMESDDPGVMMPELGRVIAHKEGVALIREWIGAMSAAAKN